jgi:hypothetical protein
MKHFKPYIIINLAYQGTDASFDKKLQAIAIELGGGEDKSGFSGGYSDLSFCFDNLKSARQFFVRAKRFKKMAEVGSRIGSASMLDTRDW